MAQYSPHPFLNHSAHRGLQRREAAAASASTTAVGRIGRGADFRGAQRIDVDGSIEGSVGVVKGGVVEGLVGAARGLTHQWKTLMIRGNFHRYLMAERKRMCKISLLSSWLLSLLSPWLLLLLLSSMTLFSMPLFDCSHCFILNIVFLSAC